MNISHRIGSKKVGQLYLCKNVEPQFATKIYYTENKKIKTKKYKSSSLNQNIFYWYFSCWNARKGQLNNKKIISPKF